MGVKFEFMNFNSVEGYRFHDEYLRYNFESITVENRSLNRGTCKINITCDIEKIKRDKIKQETYTSLLPCTLRGSAPIVDISSPSSGHYFYSSHGLYFDSYVGVGQKLIDDNHINLKNMLSNLIKHNALLRREISTNDFIVSENNKELVTPAKLAKFVADVTAKSFSEKDNYKVYFSSSGSLAVEAAMKIAYRYTHGRLIKKYGYDFEERLMNHLGIEKNNEYNHPEDKEPLYIDYPFYMITAKDAFHGRAFGALSLTNVRPVHKRGYPSLTRTKRIKFNGNIDDINQLIDDRDLDEILNSEGGVKKVLKDGYIPRELVSGFVIEAFQGEGGYIIAEKNWLNGIIKNCKKMGISVIADEVQTFCRTGRVFAFEHFDVSPDIILISKASVVGMTIASSKYDQFMPLGWHSSTWGGGKVLDNNFAWTVLNTYLNYSDPIFKGMTYIENQTLKEEYIYEMFSFFKKKYPKILIDFRGLGGMWGFSVKYRDLVTKTAWNNGLKLLSCGVTKDVSSIRLLFLADVLTKEIDCFAMLLDKTFSDIMKLKY